MKINWFARILKALKIVFIHDGNFRSIFRFVFVIVGGGLVFLDLDIWRTGWLYIVGFVVGGVGGYAARAHQLGIRPFDASSYPRGWFKGRQPKSEEKERGSNGSK
ncbi:hypothetical protein [Achromobacter spanius]|uniref:hypothetical protein n=1 Tax=Achromobacter spanius TaxID=217203 RepID=UPI003A90D1C5